MRISNGISAKSTQAGANREIPPMSDWRTSDEQEILRRRARAHAENMRIARIDSAHKLFSSFRVESKSGMTYTVEIRDLCARAFACDCVDFRINGLGTCKHVEAVLRHLEATVPGMFRKALSDPNASPRIDVTPERAAGALRVERNARELPRAWRKLVNAAGIINGSPEDILPRLSEIKDPRLRIARETAAWMEQRRRSAERAARRREYEINVQRGNWPLQETKTPLFPYQREGMLHLAFGERALLADDMGLGKTIQAIAACALLHRLGNARRVLVVTPASLKTEWEEQLRRFTDLPLQLVFGGRRARLAAYMRPPFFTIVNYEQVLADALDINRRLQPDVVVLDEAQRIKNWSTKTAQAVKRLAGRYAFVLTGTPMENRIDELRSIVDFLNPEILGPLFRFNREYYQLDEKGRPSGYRNLDLLRARVAPLLLRRRKIDVETELPERIDRQFFVPMTREQRADYDDHAASAARLGAIAKRRALTPREQDILMRELSMMRMLCDTPFIMDQTDRTCPKLSELKRILEECCADPDVKLIIFSEWERMLLLARDLCKTLGLGYAWHTGSVPQRKRRAEIQAFKSDPNCRVFLSTDSGGVGLNLQNASYVVNCDLPWTPGRLEQRIARAWRKNQSRPVTVINLITENSIESAMLLTLDAKRELAQGLLDGVGDLAKISFRGGRQAMLKRLEQVMSAISTDKASADALRPQATDPAAQFHANCLARLGSALVRIEERFIENAEESLIFAVVESAADVETARRTADAHLTPARMPFEVVTRETADALDRLAKQGMLRLNVRATRSLSPNASPTVAALTAEQVAHVNTLRDLTERRLRAARLLAANGLQEECRAPLGEAVRAAMALRSIRSGWAEPAALEDCLRQPWRRLLGESAENIATWISDQGTSPEIILDWTQSALGMVS